MNGVRKWGGFTNDVHWRVCRLQGCWYCSQNCFGGCAGIAVVNRWLVYGVGLSRFDTSTPSPMIEFSQQFISLSLYSPKMLCNCSDLLMLRPDESYTLIYDDMFR